MSKLDTLHNNRGSSNCSVLFQFDSERKEAVPWITYMKQFSDSLCRGVSGICNDCPAKGPIGLNQLLGIEPDVENNR